MLRQKPFRHPHQGVVVRTIERPPNDVIEAFKEFSAASVLDCLGKYGTMACELQALSPGMRLCGPAITCLGPDVTVRRMAIDLAHPGDVLVLAVDGITMYSCFGAATALNMQQKGIAGIVIDGATRDATQIRAMNFPTFARAVTPRNFHYPNGIEYGAVNVEVCCGGVIVRPGDLIIGDNDGVIVVPREVAEELAPIVAKAIEDERIKWEKRVNKPFNVEETLREHGYIFY